MLEMLLECPGRSRQRETPTHQKNGGESLLLHVIELEKMIRSVQHIQKTTFRQGLQIGTCDRYVDFLEIEVVRVHLGERFLHLDDLTQQVIPLPTVLLQRAKPVDGLGAFRSLHLLSNEGEEESVDLIRTEIVLIAFSQYEEGASCFLHQREPKHGRSNITDEKELRGRIRQRRVREHCCDRLLHE